MEENIQFEIKNFRYYIIVYQEGLGKSSTISFLYDTDSLENYTSYISFVPGEHRSVA
jgi:hypothetical protein